MNNKIFIDRCETIVVSMKMNGHEVTSKKVAEWLKCTNAAACQVLAKVCKAGIVEKRGAASKTTYQISGHFENSLSDSLRRHNGNLTVAAAAAVSWFIEHPQISVERIVTADGRKLNKIVSKEKLSEENQAAINCLLSIMKQNGDLLAEVQLLREEVQRLSEYEQKYKQIKSLMK